MDADNDVRTPLFKQVLKVSETAFVKKLARLGTKPVDAQYRYFIQPCLFRRIQLYRLTHRCVTLMRLLNASNDADSSRLALPKALKSVSDSLSGGPMPTAGIG